MDFSVMGRSLCESVAGGGLASSPLLERATSFSSSKSNAVSIRTRETDPYNDDASFYKDNANPVLECDYDNSVHALYSAVEGRRWDDVRRIFHEGDSDDEEEDDNILNNDDDESELTKKRDNKKKTRSAVMATTWVYRLHPGTNRLKWRINPLHACVIFDAPPDVMRLVRDAHPSAAKLTDDKGNLPLHLAYKNGLDEERMEILLEAYPRGVDVENHLGLTPVQCAAFCQTSDRYDFWSQLFITSTGSMMSMLSANSINSGSRGLFGNASADGDDDSRPPEWTIDGMFQKLLLRQGGDDLSMKSDASASSPPGTEQRWGRIARDVEDLLREEKEKEEAMLLEEQFKEIDEEFKWTEGSGGVYFGDYGEDRDDVEDGDKDRSGTGPKEEEVLADRDGAKDERKDMSETEARAEVAKDGDDSKKSSGVGGTAKENGEGGQKQSGGGARLRQKSSSSSKPKKKKKKGGGVLGMMKKSFASKKKTPSIGPQQSQSQPRPEDVPEVEVKKMPEKEEVKNTPEQKAQEKAPEKEEGMAAAADRDGPTNVSPDVTATFPPEEEDPDATKALVSKLMILLQQHRKQTEQQSQQQQHQLLGQRLGDVPEEETLKEELEKKERAARYDLPDLSPLEISATLSEEELGMIKNYDFKKTLSFQDRQQRQSQPWMYDDDDDDDVGSADMSVDTITLLDQIVTKLQKRAESTRHWEMGQWAV